MTLSDWAAGIRCVAAAVAVAGAVAAALPAQSEEAASDPRNWGYERAQKSVPVVPGDKASWCRDDIDRFVVTGLHAAGLSPSPVADPAVLLRRLHLVLTGLPPGPEAVREFLADPSDATYDRIVDELLRSRAAAEHLASDWLDLARFADTYGYQADFECRTWPWRDWLIRSLHENKPWDRFVREIVAGDLLPDATIESRTATAFWRLHRQTNEGGSIEEEWRHEYIADRVDTFGATFLGLTVGCARCHDHKSDPISQRDYYALGSFFAIDESGLAPYSTGGVPQPAIRLMSTEQRAEAAELRAAVATAQRAFDAALPDAAQRAIEPVAERLPELRCDGDRRTRVKDVPGFTRADPFRLELELWNPTESERAVVLHTSRYTLDADTQGYQILTRDGRLCWEIVHHWPGSAIAVRTKAPLPTGRWVRIVASYDGSSRAAGLGLTLDGAEVAIEVVRDHLQGPATVRTFELGGRDRDRGFAGGRIRNVRVFDDCVTAASQKLRDARRALHAFVERIPELMVMAPHRHSPARYLLRRGAYDDPDPAQPVPADVPASVLSFGERSRDRLGLADWLLAPENPLTARVAVNRLWRLAFGRGLVAAADNFGTLGGRPRQLALLDALAVDFQNTPDMRAMLRRIVQSSTFRQASTCSPELRERDPDNELLARGPSFRLTAEVLRDSALAASGLLSDRSFGPSSKPWQPPGIWRDAGVGWGGADYKPDQGADAHRRSLYTYRKRTAPPPDMNVLDAPSREVCIAARQSTATPLQALVFFNDPVFTECAAAAAESVVGAMPGSDGSVRLRELFLRLAGRLPQPAELRALMPLLQAGSDDCHALTLAASTLMASDVMVMLR
ncbi:MAG: DUF1549 domain-containing protein [bacterium]|nr:DUF1549 domain-containing protein [bacterium]